MKQSWRYHFWNGLDELCTHLRWWCDDLSAWFEDLGLRAGIRATRYECPRPNTRKET